MSLILRSVKGSKLTIAEMDGNFTFVNKPQNNAIWVESLSDLPDPVVGVITLGEDETYWITNNVDLLGNRIVCSGPLNILGFTSESSSITSTGLTNGVAMITTAFSIVMRDVTLFDVHTLFDINGQGLNDVALDWTGVNIIDVTNIGAIQNFDNFIFDKGAFIRSDGCTFNGTADTISFANSLFVGTGLGITIFEFLSDSVISRRVRFIYSAFTVFGTDIGIDVDNAVTIPDEAFIFDTVNFSGGGNYINGLLSDDIKSLWINNLGIKNSVELCYYTMVGNATLTDIVTINVPVKIAGITVNNALTQKFESTNNRATCKAGIQRIYKVGAVLSAAAGNNHELGVYVYKNGIQVIESEVLATTTAAGRAESIKCQSVVELVLDDYIEIWIKNKTTNVDIIVIDLSVIIEALN